MGHCEAEGATDLSGVSAEVRASESNDSALEWAGGWADLDNRGYLLVVSGRDCGVNEVWDG